MALATTHETISDVDTELRTGGSGPALLYLHGGHGLEGQDGFLDALAANFSVVAPALPGFGETEWPRDLRTMGDLACFALEVCDHAGLAETTLVGSGFGGWIALDILVRGHKRFARAVLVDTLGVKLADHLTREISDLHGLDAGEVQRRLFHDPAVLPRDPAVLDDAALTAIARARETFTFFGWKPYMHDPSLRRWLHRIDVPTLVAWGAEDGFVSPDLGRRIAAAIPGARFELMPAAGHYPPIEQPQALSRLIQDFASESGGEAAA